MNTTRLTDTRLLILSIVLSGGIFAIDLSLPLGVASGVPYVVIVLASLWSPKRRDTYLAASTGTALTALGYFFSAAGGIFWMVLVNRFLALFVIWAAALLVLQRKSAEAALRKSEKRYRNLFHQAPISLWEEDFSALQPWFAELRKTGVSDLGEYLQHHPEAVQKAARLVRVIDVNEGTLRLFGAGSMAELFSAPLKAVGEHKGSAFSNQAFAEQLIAIWEGRRRFETEFAASTSGGAHIDCLLQWVAPRTPGNLDLSYVIIALSDITDRKRAETALRESELWMHNIFNSLEESVFVVTADRHLVNVNAAAERTFGYSKDELADLSTEILHVDHDHYVEFGKQIQEAFDRSETACFEFELQRKNGQVFPSEHTVSLLKDDAGKAIGIVSVVRDITERKRVDEALKEMNIALANAMPGIARLDIDGRYVEVNDIYAGMMGFQADEMIGSDWKQTVHPEDHAVALQAYKRMLLEGKGEFEARGARKDATTFFKHVLMVKMTDKQGAPTGHHCFMRDITERKQAEQALRESEERFRAIFEDAPVGISVTDSVSGRFIEINKEYGDICGYSQAEMLKTSFQEISHPDDLEDDLSHMRDLLDGKTKNFEMEKRYFHKDGSIIWVSMTCVQLWKTEDDPRVHLTIVQDITERKQAERALRESEERFRRVVTNINDALIVDDDEGRIVYANDRFLDMFGFARQDLPSLGLDSYIAPQWRERLRGYHDRRVRGEEAPERFEYEGRRKDGGSLWLEVCVTQVMSSGKVVGTQSLLRDITDRKRAEDALRESERRLRSVLGGLYEAPVGLCFLDRELRYVYVNQWLADLNGISVEDHLGRTIREVLPDIEAGAESQLRQVMETGEPVIEGTVEVETAADPVQKRVFQHNYYPVVGDDGSVVGVSCAIQDITRRRRAEAERARLTTAIEELVEAVAITDPDGIIEYVNPAFERMTGYRPSEAIGQNMRILKSGRHDQAFYEEFWGTIKSGQVWTGTFINRKKDGTIYEEEESISPVHDERGKITNYVAVKYDITERKQAEEALRASEERYHDLYDNAPDMFCSVDAATGRVIECNLALAEATGYAKSEVIGRHISELYHPDCEMDRQIVFKAFTQIGEVHDAELQLRRKDGEKLHVSLNISAVRDAQGNILHSRSIWRDITKRKHAEQALLESEKQVHKHQEELAHLSRLSTMGEMATGLAHELNQPLASIVNYTSGCVQRIQAGRTDLQELVGVLKDASSEAQRAGEIIKRIRRFVQRREPARMTIDIAELIRQVLDLMRHDLQQQGIQMQLEVEEHLPTLQGDRIQLQQVLVNLLRNSIEAMNETEMEHRHLTIGAATNNEDSVTLFVLDRGRGLGEADSDSIFEPFYTTRKDGTGMGLAISRTIIEAHGGHLWATDNADGGCTFHFSLPRHTELTGV